MKKTFLKNKLTYLLILCVSILMLSSCSPARKLYIPRGWELLGYRKVNFVRDVDDINVSNDNRFTAVRFVVKDGNIRIRDLKVYFDNGDKLEPKIDETVSEGQTSRDIELGREGRNISKIEFKYRTTGSMLKGRARVFVLGKRYR